VDVRVLAATNKNLLEEVEAKKFRLDLYHRLSVILIQVPSLNSRRDDIPLLVDHFLKSLCDEYKQPVKTVHPDAMASLQQHNWTGNIRELKNAVERLIILSDNTITKNDVEQYILLR